MSRPAKLIIYTNSFKNNIRVLKRYTNSAKVWACVKAGAYGHGIESAVNGLEEADGLAVLEVSEAFFARSLGWNKPILLLEGVFSRNELDEASALNLELVIHNEQQLAWYLERKKTVHGVWIKINSGMNRLGFSDGKNNGLIKSSIEKIRNQYLKSSDIKWMTHFSSGGCKNSCEDQIKTFRSTANKLGYQKGEKVSFSNSEAVICNPNFSKDWVRPGILLYGAPSSLNPNKKVRSFLEEVIPCQSLQSKLVTKLRVKKGAKIGYGGTYSAVEEMTVGVAAIGYADGYPRGISKDTCCLVLGKACRVIGVVSMDLIHIDLTPCPEAVPGDVVECWGKDLPILDVAKSSNRLCYELFTGITSRVSREIV